MKTGPLSLALCFFVLSVHAKILVFTDLSELRQLSLPSCESFAQIKFSTMKKRLDKRGIQNSNGAGYVKFGDSLQFINGALCSGTNGSKIPSWVNLVGAGTFFENGTPTECKDFELYQWEYMVKWEDAVKCNCKARGVDSSGNDLYPATYFDIRTRELIPGYVQSKELAKTSEDHITYVTNTGYREYRFDSIFVVC